MLVGVSNEHVPRGFDRVDADYSDAACDAKQRFDDFFEYVEVVQTGRGVEPRMDDSAEA